MKLVSLFPHLPADVIDSLSLLGSHEDQVLLLLNSFLLCVVNLDPEFGRISIQQCLPIEPTTDPYVDDSLPQEVGPLANFAFRSPLLFALTQDGLVCILHTVIILRIANSTLWDDHKIEC